MLRTGLYKDRHLRAGLVEQKAKRSLTKIQSRRDCQYLRLAATCLQCPPGFMHWLELTTVHTCPSGVVCWLLVPWLPHSSGWTSPSTQESAWTWGLSSLGPTSAGSPCQICWVPDYSHLTLDNPPSLAFVPCVSCSCSSGQTCLTALWISFSPTPRDSLFPLSELSRGRLWWEIFSSCLDCALQGSPVWIPPSFPCLRPSNSRTQPCSPRPCLRLLLALSLPLLSTWPDLHS